MVISINVRLGRRGERDANKKKPTKLLNSDGFDHFTCDCEWHNSVRILCLFDRDNINYADSNFEICTEIIGLLSEKKIENLFTMKKGM